MLYEMQPYAIHLLYNIQLIPTNNKCSIMEPNKTLVSLLAPGDIGIIAKGVGLSHSAAAAAIRRGNPGHPAVREALKLAEQSGALAAAQQLAKLTPAA